MPQKAGQRMKLISYDRRAIKDNFIPHFPDPAVRIDL